MGAEWVSGASGVSGDGSGEAARVVVLGTNEIRR